MKKILIFILSSILLYSQNITESSLPLRAKNFININFPGDKIESVNLHKNDFIFYETGLWKSVKANDTNLTIPRSCIHKNMVNTIDREYPLSKINYIERRDKNFLIILNNKIEIELSGYGLIINKRDIN